MRKLLHSALLAVSALMLAIPVSAASAQDMEIQIGPGGPSMRMQRNDCDPRYEECFGRRGPERRDEWRGPDRRDERRGREECSPERALRKAERMGIRRPRIESVGRRTINIIGRSRGDNVIVTFDRRDRGCPVLR